MAGVGHAPDHLQEICKEFEGPSDDLFPLILVLITFMLDHHRALFNSFASMFNVSEVL